MAVGRTNSGAGSSKGAVKKATILVTYPVGAICAVNNGTKTYTALDTSGSATFIVELGTWTASATSGTDSASEAVEITSDIPHAYVELTFGLFLFDYGDECTALTGGWEAIGKSGGADGWRAEAPTVTKNADSYNISFPANRGSIFATSKKIDLSGYNTLKILLRHDKAFTTAYKHFIFGVFDSSNLTMNGMGNAMAKIALGETDVGKATELSVDISAINEGGNIGIAHYKDTVDVVDYLWKVWAVK